MTTDETNRCLTGGSDGKCKIWDLNTVMIDKEQTQPKCLFVLDNNHTTSDNSSITSICITFDNNKCITTRKNENQCDIWDINTGVHLHTLKGYIAYLDVLNFVGLLIVVMVNIKNGALKKVNIYSKKMKLF